MKPQVIKMMFDITDKQYSRWLINWRLCAMWVEQFQRKDWNDTEWLQYYTDKYNELYGKTQTDFIDRIKIFWIEKEKSDIFNQD